MNNPLKGKRSILAASVFLFVTLIFYFWASHHTSLTKEISYNTLYNGPWNANELADWKINFGKYDYETNDLESILMDSVGILQEDSTITKVQKIAGFIIPRTEGRFGNQNLDVLKGHDPYEQLCLINEGRTGVLCGMVSFIYAYFLENAGIISRYISLEKFNDEIIGTHVVLEIFIPETGKWIYSDLTYGIKFVEAGNEKLNLLQLIEAGKNNPALLTSTMKNDEEIPFRDLDGHYRYYMNSVDQVRYFPGRQLRNSLLPFSTREKFFNKINPTYAYLLYSNDPGSIPGYWIIKISRWLVAFAILLLSLLLVKRIFKF